MCKTTSKVCIDCKEEKPITEFYPNGTSKNGTKVYRPACKVCVRLFVNTGYRPERHKPEEGYKTCSQCGTDKLVVDFHVMGEYIDGSIRYNSSCKTCTISSASKWAKANPEKVNTNSKKWRDENPETCKINGLKWAKENPGARLAIKAKRRALKKLAIPPWFEQESIKELYKVSTSKSFDEGVSYHVDHIVPLVNDRVCGLHCLDNLQIITAKENMSKSNRHWPDM